MNAPDFVRSSLPDWRGNQPWILINGVNGVGVTNELGQYTFSAAENTTGSSRTGTITIDKNNSRVTGITAHVITITQSA